MTTLKDIIGNNETNIIESNTPHNKKILREAYRYAKAYSHDDSTYVGAIAIPKNNSENKIYGANIVEGYSCKEDVPADLLKKPAKYSTIDHAEKNLLKNAKKEGVSLKGAHVFLNWSPCKQYGCSTIFIDEKISELTIHMDTVLRTPEDWIPDLIKAHNHLIENGIKISYVSGKLGVEARMRKKDYIA